MSLFKIIQEGSREYSAVNMHLLEKDNRLSWKAKALHVYLMSRPSGWTVHEADLVNRAADQRDAVRSGLRELEQYGYLTRKQKTDPQTKVFQHTEFYVRTHPVDGFSGDGLAVDGKPGHLEGPDGRKDLNPSGEANYASPRPPQGARKKPIRFDIPTPSAQSVPKSSAAAVLAVADVPRPRKPKPPVRTFVPKNVVPILAYWNQIGVQHKPGTQVFKDGVVALRQVMSGTFKNDEYPARAFSEKEIMLALTRFELMRNSPDHEPKFKPKIKKVTLAMFFYSPYWKPSLFLRCIKSGPRLVIDQDAEFTEFVREAVWNKVKAKVEYDSAARAASKLGHFLAERRAWLRGFGVETKNDLCNRWVEFLESRRPGNWDIGAIITQHNNQRFETWLRKERG